MSQSLFGDRIPPACTYCEAALKTLLDGRHVLCKRQGVVLAESACRRFVYDPLKREPHRPLVLPTFVPDDFSL